MFLNPSAPAAAYKKMSASRFFVDKSRLLAELVQSMDDNQKYICITRPRRFGKTVIWSAHFSAKALDAVICSVT